MRLNNQDILLRRSESRARSRIDRKLAKSARNQVRNSIQIEIWNLVEFPVRNVMLAQLEAR